jgi:uncharacterized protein (DUF1800 family)
MVRVVFTRFEQFRSRLCAMQSAGWTATARLLRRTGFGATGAAVDVVERMGIAAHVHDILQADPTADSGARRTPAPTFETIAPLGKSASKDKRQQRNHQIRRQLSTLTTWWIRRMVAVEEPFGEKLTFLWHNHFATAATKVRRPAWMAGQNETLRRAGRGDFRTLALAMLTDPAMLFWLDGQKNSAAAPNENLSREFMELFALGHGDGYTEQDVREGARALTGWRFRADGTAFLSARAHDNGSKTVLGVTGNLDTTGFCDAVLARPASPRFVASRIWSQLVSARPPDAATLDRLVAAYGSRRDLGALLTAMLTSPEFSTAAGTIVVDPVEWLIGAVRALRVPIADDAAALKLVAVLRVLGQIPFYPPNVSGWPSGAAWLSTAAADARMQAATALAGEADLDAVRGSTAAKVDAVGHLLGVGSWSSRSSAVLAEAAADPRRLVAIALNTPEYLTN